MHIFRILLALCLYGGSDSLPHLRCRCFRKCHNKQTVNIYRMLLIGNSLNDSLDPVSYTHLDVYKRQGQYIKMFKEQNMNAVILDHNIDTSFITQLEQRNEHYQFKRIDADVTDALKSDDTADLTEETTTLSDLFKKTLNNDKLTVKVESLKDADVASILTLVSYTHLDVYKRQDRCLDDIFIHTNTPVILTITGNSHICDSF